jgi:hypothetical protein
MRKDQLVSVAMFVTALGATPVAAQELEVTIGGGRVNDARGAERTGVSIAPVVAWTDGLSTASLSGSATLLDGGERVWGAGLGTRLELVRVGLASLDLTGGGRVETSEGWSGGSARLSPRLSATGFGWRASAGPVWAGAHHSSVTEVPSERLLPGGGTTTERETRTRVASGLSVSAGVVQGVASLSGEWLGLRSDSLAWEEIGLGASVVVQGVTVAGSLGARLGDGRATWGGASAAIPVGSAAALLLEGGRFPSDVLLERPGGRYLTAGLRVRV